LLPEFTSEVFIVKTLEDQIDDLEKLDELRRRARQLQKEAIEALTATEYEPSPRNPKSAAKIESKRPNWLPPGDDVEKALLLRALSTLKPKDVDSEKNWNDTKRKLIDDLQALRPAHFVVKGGRDNMSIFRAALALQALAETPDHALSKASFSCFFRVVQELNEIAPPAWVSGAARAGNQAASTAFIAAECTRGLLTLKHALQQTATAVELLGQEAKRARLSRGSFNYGKWLEQEKKFREASIKITLDALEPELAFSLSPKSRASAERLILDIADKLRRVPSVPSVAKVKAPRTRNRADRMQDIVTRQLKWVAEDIAWNAVSKLRQTIKLPGTIKKNAARASTPSMANGIAAKLRSGAQVIDELLGPLEHYATSIIDRELAAGTQHLDIRVDAAELVFAANLLGLVGGWDKPKVKAAYEAVRPLLSVNGRMLSLRSFDVLGGGYRLNVQTVEIIRRLADLVAHLDVEPELAFFERLMRPFEDTRVRAEKKSESGWTVDLAERESKSIWWMTALVTKALESINHMLDQNINRQVLRHFQVRTPESLKLGLDDLFYPDFGVAASKDKGESVALRLQQLRAHAGSGPVEAKPLFSMILYGPPGTGKTTLIEAVAKSANVKLVEVTPSDVLAGGAEAVERRTRHVFKALSKLTHVVILFDEFDSILLDRGKRDPDKIPTSVIEFLTPGMLPKLKELNDASKERRISYLLATNFLDALDPAVTRGGRFDYKLGIYPPDVVSRLGRLVNQLERLKNDKKGGLLERIGKSDFDPKKALLRILMTVNCTRSAAMDKLGKLGWYTMPRGKGDFEKTLFGLIVREQGMKGLEEELKDLEEGSTRKEWSQIVLPEVYYEEDKKKYDRQRSKREGVESDVLPDLPYWKEWEVIDNWDKKFGAPTNAATNWKAVFALLDELLKELP
jgi:hypothetical protein